MKRNRLFIFFGIILVLVVAIITAGEMGNKPQALAKGRIVLDDALISLAQPSKDLFIIVHDANQPRPPYGVLRVPVSRPIEKQVYEFVLTYANVQRMVPDKAWPENFNIKVRLDSDGQGGPDRPGDLTGIVKNLTRGATDIVIKIDNSI